MTIQKARKLLGDEAKNYSDKEVEGINASLDELANILIDMFMALPPEEKVKWKDPNYRPN